MRPPPPGEGEISQPPQERKRRRASSSDNPKPKKSKIQKSKVDTVVLPVDAQDDDDDCILVAHEGGSTAAPKVVKPVVNESVRSQVGGVSDEDVREVPEPSVGKEIPCCAEKSAEAPEGSSSEAPRREEYAPSDSP